MGFCFGLIFGPGIFWGFVRGPRDIFWILICFYAPIRHLKSRVPTPPGRYMLEYLPQKILTGFCFLQNLFAALG